MGARDGLVLHSQHAADPWSSVPRASEGAGFGHNPLPSRPLPQDVSKGCWKRLPTLCVNRAAPPREVIFPCVFCQGRLCWKTSIQDFPKAGDG